MARVSIHESINVAAVPSVLLRAKHGANLGNYAGVVLLFPE
jgi:hypothetical protein